ncbi:MAG: ATP-binding cassette domain-containing protein [Rhodobacteraceae bacterium]|nr:ATP-binding cassette domain-containing protein [Paracoccaceae bacterium]
MSKSQKRSSSLQPLLPFWNHLRKYRLAMSLAILALLSAAGLTLLLPNIVRGMIDNGFATEQTDIIKTHFWLLLGLLTALAAASALRYYTVMWLGERVVADIRAQVFDHVLHLSLPFFDKERSGEILSRLTADTTQIKSAIGASASQALRNLVLFIGAIAMMIFTSPGLASLVLGAIPLIVIPLILFGRQVRMRSHSAQETLASSAAFAGEMIGHIRSVQSFTQESATADNFKRATERAFQAAKNSIGARALLTFLAICIIGTSILAVLWIGINRVMEGNLSGGELGQFFLYSVFAAGSLASLSEVWGEMTLAAGAAERLAQLLTTQADIQSPNANALALPPKLSGKIEFQNACFSYQPASKQIALEDISATIKPGETIAIVGPSGAGKSTLFSLISRFYDLKDGKILIDDLDITQLDLKGLRSQIALVPQDPAIFAGTIQENIAFGDSNASFEAIQKAAQTAAAEGFIQELEHGYETTIGERGITLSGGQKQRIAIARAILKDAPILLLDEATSALDADSEAEVQSALKTLMEGRTTLVIAHRLSTVQDADRVLVMDKGKIIEQGTHSELVKQNGLYAHLASLQLSSSSLEV